MNLYLKYSWERHGKVGKKMNTMDLGFSSS